MECVYKFTPCKTVSDPFDLKVGVYPFALKIKKYFNEHNADRK